MSQYPGDNQVMGTSPQPLPYNILSYDMMLVDMSHLLNRILRVRGSDSPYMDMVTSTGVPTGGVFGVIKSLRGILGRPDLVIKDVVAVWDGRPRGLSPRRIQLLPSYKERVVDPNATPDPDEVRFRTLYEEQRPRIDSVLVKLGVPVINIPLVEGDDVIANLARRIQGKVLIVSSDRDFFQLVSDNIHIYRPIEDVFVTPDSFVRLASTQTPANFLMMKAITGDSSDNIPGIPDVGGTTAQRVASEWHCSQWYPLAQFDRAGLKESAFRLMESDKRNRKRYSKLVDNLDVVERNYYLVNLILEELSPAEWALATDSYRRRSQFNEMEIGREFVMYEFRSIVEKLTYWLEPFRTLSSQR